MGDRFLETTFFVQTFQIYKAVDSEESEFPAAFFQYFHQSLVRIGKSHMYIVFYAMIP